MGRGRRGPTCVVRDRTVGWGRMYERELCVFQSFQRHETIPQPNVWFKSIIKKYIFLISHRLVLDPFFKHLLPLMERRIGPVHCLISRGTLMVMLHLPDVTARCQPQM